MTPRRIPGSGSAPQPVERAQGSRPEDESWRADALAGSRHSRWIDELREPLDLHDRDRAAEICGQVARVALQDFAPGLMLLSERDRARAQTLAAYVLILLDFARQTGLEGERLTAVNRWEFELEAALDGEPTGQPVFVQLHALEQERPWPREAFDRLHAYARRRIAQRRPAHREAAELDAERLAGGVAWALLDQEPSPELTRFLAALLRVRGLQDLGDDLRRHRVRLPISEVPDSWTPGDADDLETLTHAVLRECDRIEPILEDGEVCDRLPARFRRATRYCQRSGLSLVAAVRTAGPAILETPPGIGLWRRLALLTRSRW